MLLLHSRLGLPGTLSLEWLSGNERQANMRREGKGCCLANPSLPAEEPPLSHSHLVIRAVANLSSNLMNLGIILSMSDLYLDYRESRSSF